MGRRDAAKARPCRDEKKALNAKMPSRAIVAADAAAS
jgi:hypothetical protein